MPQLLRMPEVAAGATSAVLSSWAIETNTPFRAQDTLLTVETAKAVVDIEAEDDGVLFALLVPAGAEVDTGTPIALMGAPGEQLEDLGASLAELGASPAAPESSVVPESSIAPDSRSDTKSALALDVPEADRDPAPAAPRIETESQAASPAQRSTEPSVSAIAVDASVPQSAPRIFISPLARRMARDAGLSADQIQGTGPNRRIVRRDVEAATTGRASPATAVTDGRATTVTSGSATTVAGGPAPYIDVPHSRLRRAIADRLVHSTQNAPHFFLRSSVRADALLRLREQINETSQVRVSINDLVVKAVALAQLRVPEMNVIWTADAVRTFSTADVAVAVATPDGLLTPVVRGAESASIVTIATATRDFADRARAGAIRQRELEGGSITVTNLGMFGTEEFSAIINPPHAAILAVGAIRQEPVVDDGVVHAGALMRLTASVDHRPVDGIVAARWMQALVALLEKPIQLLLE